MAARVQWPGDATPIAVRRADGRLLRRRRAAGAQRARWPRLGGRRRRGRPRRQAPRPARRDRARAIAEPPGPRHTRPTCRAPPHTASRAAPARRPRAPPGTTAAATRRDRRPLAVLRAPRAVKRRRRPPARRLDVELPCKENGDVCQQRSGSRHRHRAARRRARAGRRLPLSARSRAVTALVEPEFWARLASIVLIDLTLAGDNALVIALAVRTLPQRQQFLGRVWGTAGAVALRLAFIVVATWLLTIPLLQVVGGLLLVWIALRLVRQDAAGDAHVRQGTTLREAVWIIMVADAAMSIDNVLAVAAAAQGEMLLVLIGIGLSLPIVVWGSGLLAWLMNRFTWIIWLGGGVLGYFAGEMILRDQIVERWIGPRPGWLEAVPIVLALAIAALGWRFAQNGRKHVAESA
ncbi:MAG: hypothetical protein DMD85_05155 [Candidatus Rokuibacteriota bacterium]|nr:MAG: hypothetical protein DMD85_05155 [Candidatus Rokubacteria bacterium]